MNDNHLALIVRNDILDVAAMLPALRARLRPSGGQASGVRTAPASKPPIVVEVSDLLAEVHWQAEFNARELLEAGDYSPSGLTTEAYLLDVAARVGHWTADEDTIVVLEFTDTWHEARRKVAGAISTRERPRWLGPCPADECVGALYLRAGKTDARCDECAREVGTQEIREHLAVAFEERLMSRSELVSALTVMGATTKIDTVHKWVQRGRLVAAVIDPDLFRFSDALGLAEKGRVA